MRYDRSIAISNRHSKLLSLISNGAFSSPILAEKLGVSEPTIYRDIVFLRQQGHKIESVKLSSKWAYKLEEKDENKRPQTKRRVQ